jgi:hypothetical protein
MLNTCSVSQLPSRNTILACSRTAQPIHDATALNIVPLRALFRDTFSRIIVLLLAAFVSRGAIPSLLIAAYQQLTAVV